MSQFLILIYDDEDSCDERRAEQRDEADGGPQRRSARRTARPIVGGNALQPSPPRRPSRPDGAGGFTVTDGPFVETKEALGGYYLVEAADLDAAIEIAKEVPADSGGVEVRPIMVFN